MERADQNLNQPRPPIKSSLGAPWLRPLQRLEINPLEKKSPDYQFILGLMQAIEEDQNNFEMLAGFEPHFLKEMHERNRAATAFFLNENMKRIHQELESSEGIPVQFDFEDGTSGRGLVVGLRSFEHGRWGIFVKRSISEEIISTHRTALEIRQGYVATLLPEVIGGEEAPASEQIV